MITTIYNFSELLQDVKELKEYYGKANNPFKEFAGQGKVLICEIKNKKYTGLTLEDFSKDLISKYLYRKLDGARATSIVPTLYVNTSSPKKTSDKFKKSINILNHNIISNEDITKLLNDFSNYDFDRNYKYIVTLRIDGKYLGENEKYLNVFEDNAYNKYFCKSIGESKSDDGICAITGEKGKVYGYIDILGFTVDSKAFRRNGFDASDSYKMFPVSMNCIPILEGGENIFLNKLSKSFVKNIKYAIIPHFIFLPNKEIGIEIAKKFLDKCAFNINRTDSSGAHGFINDTEAILNEIIEDKDLKRENIYYDIIFYEQQQAQFKTHLEINDIIPSRINLILKSKERAENQYAEYTTYTTKDENVVSYRITLFRLREYFLTKEDIIKSSFYELIKSIFTNQTFDDSKLISLILAKWNEYYKQYYYNDKERYKFESFVKNTLSNLYFLNLLGIFNKNTIMKEKNKTIEKQDAFIFIDSHSTYFSKDYLKGVFIFGCLVARLLYNQPGNAFMKELNGLNIDVDLINKKFPKLISKLRQFDREFPDLESAALRYFATENKGITKDEISFVFTMGLVLQKDFDKINKSIINQNNNNNE